MEHTYYLVYGTWHEDGDCSGNGNILGVFRDKNKAEDTMIKTARESFDYYDTEAECRFCDYYDLERPCDQASNNLYRIIEEVEYRTDLCLIHYKHCDTLGDKAYVIFGTEDYNKVGYYPMKNIYATATEAIQNAVHIETNIWDENDVPLDKRQAWAGKDEDGNVFKIGDADLDSWLYVKEITVQ